MLEINTNLFLNGCKNDLISFTAFSIGYGVAYGVDKIAHKFFKCEFGSPTSRIVRVAAFCAGTAAGIYAASFLPIHPFTISQTLSTLAITLPIYCATNFAISILRNNAIIVPTPGVIGPVAGLIGRPAIAILSAVWAMTALMVNDAENRPNVNLRAAAKA